MNNNSTRNKDIIIENKFHNYLKDNFYNKFDNYIDIKDIDNQINGIDIILENNNKKFNIDEKLQVTKINIPITKYTTQCFELKFLSRDGNLNFTNIYKKGWFLDNNKTDFYLISYIEKGSINNPLNTKLLLISKDDIYNLLDDYGYDIYYIERLSDLMEYNDFYCDIKSNGNKYIRFKNTPFWLCKSYNIPEKPINLIIRWNILEKYATKSFDLIGNLVA